MQDLHVLEETLEVLQDTVRRKQDSKIFGKTGSEISDERRDAGVEFIESHLKRISLKLQKVCDDGSVEVSSSPYIEAFTSFVFWSWNLEDYSRRKASKLLKQAEAITTTTARFREEYKHIYRAAYYEVLPGLDEWSGLADKSHTIVGSCSNFAASRPLFSKALETAHKYDKLFTSLCTRMAALLDVTQKKKIGMDVRDSILHAAKTFQMALIASQTDVSVRLVAHMLLNDASNIVLQLERHVKARESTFSIAPISIASLAEVTAPQQDVENSNALSDLAEIRKLVEQMKIHVDTCLELGTTPLSDQNHTGTPLNVLAMCLGSADWPQSLPSSSQPLTEGNEFTLGNFLKRLGEDQRLREFNGTYGNNHDVQSEAQREGAFAIVYKVKLPQQLQYTAPFDAQPIGRQAWIQWTVKEVAVKVVVTNRNDPEERLALRLFREYQTWSKMHHPRILPLLGIWFNFPLNTSNALPALVSPWLEDDHLRVYLRTRPSLPRVKRLALVSPRTLNFEVCNLKFTPVSLSNQLQDVAEALAYMHNQRPIACHGDVNSQNVLVQQERAFLCDFGISHILSSVRGCTTDPHGNWLFRAPERLDCSADSKPTPQSDMYSFGSLFFEVMAGKLPWKGKSLGARLMNKYAYDPKPEGMPIDDYLFAEYCWKEDPRLRMTASIAVEELEKLKAL